MTTASRALNWGALTVVGMAALVSTSWAAGKKPPAPPSGPFTPAPVRSVVTRPVGTKAFRLPNGKEMDLSADFNAMFETSVTQTGVFSATTPSGRPSPCDMPLEIQADITTLQMEVGSARIRVGYSPTGTETPSVGVEGTVGVKVGVIAMDFKVWRYNPTTEKWSSVVASTVQQPFPAFSMAFNINISDIKIGPELIYNTPLGGVIRDMMRRGLAEIVKQKDSLERLGWMSRVLYFDSDTGTVIFEQGWDHLIGNDQTFTVYAPVEDAIGIGCTELPVADIRTTRVDSITSIAIVDEFRHSRGIQPGDSVRIRRVR
jgi:hypothetical protein